MEFIAPIPYADAIQKLGDQSVVGSTFSSSEWSDLPVELRENAFFSSRVESARFLDRAQGALGDFLAGNKIPAEKVPLTTVLATGSRAAFVSQMQQFLEDEGVVRTSGGLKDIASEKRLGLIFDVKTRQAQDFGYWKQGMDTDVLNEFPAQRFIRVREVKTEREAHIPFEGQVFLKTDPIWWLVINKDFGVPWGPWGWGCGHDVQDEDRATAVKLGLLRPGQQLALGPLKKFLNFNSNLQASVKTMPEELLEKLKQEFGERVVIEDDTLRWRGQPGDVGVGERMADAERLALNAYTRSDYRIVNRGLRSGDLSNYVNNKADLITQALASLPAYEGTVTRGAMLTTEDLAQYQPGNVAVEKGFISAARSTPFPGNVIFTIESRNGKRIARYSSFKGETEVLFDQGSRFRVISRKFANGVWNIALEEL